MVIFSDIDWTVVLLLPYKEVDDGVCMLFLEDPVWVSDPSLSTLSLWFTSSIAGRTLHAKA